MSTHLYAPISFHHKSAMSKLRISAHNLPVETGLPRDERICPFCSDEVGNEVHYFTKCDYPHFIDLRTKLFDCPYLLTTSPNSNNEILTISLLNTTDPKMMSKIGDFLDGVMKHFKILNTVPSQFSPLHLHIPTIWCRLGFIIFILCKLFL